MTILKERRQPIWIWYLSLILFYAVWACLVFGHDHWETAKENWPIAAAMTVGSYAAGSTPMGGGTVGFPILVLLFDKPAELGRDFSFAIQAIGMTSASILILCRRQPLAWAMLKGSLLGSSIGLPIGILVVAPWVSALWIKISFAVLWGSFGILHLWRMREIAEHDGMTEFDERWDGKVGFAAGLLSGITVVSVSGVGVDMVLYSVLILLCRADLKIAIPTSVVVMAYNSVFGVLTKMFFTGVEPGVFESWLAAAPVVALGAPLGVFVVQLIGRVPTLVVVAILCVGQLFWTLQREWEHLGIVGAVLSLSAVGLCLLGFEKLRRLGGTLVEENRRRNGADTRSSLPSK